MQAVLEVKEIWKQYHRGIDRKYKSFRDSLSNIHHWWSGNEQDRFWALEDISFQVEQGDSLGIIGRNGAGKSTLLKILSRITPPSRGEIILRGRVASLLEVGTGFHPELTGRENIFFNGSILGMRYHEIKNKFDEIVDFSGISHFIDTPLKHYSSGMQMRLAFAVAAHLDAEILLIDEVLAVGDAAFQKKCIGKMDEVSKSEGKTILFVSHDLRLTEKICNKGILLTDARITGMGSAFDVVQIYKEMNLEILQHSNASIDLTKHKDKKGHYGIKTVQVKCDDIASNEFYPGCNLKFVIKIHKKELLINPEVGLAISDYDGNYIVGLNNNHLNTRIRKDSSEIDVTFEFKYFKIYKPGDYFFNLYFGDEDIEYEMLMNAGTLHCIPTNTKSFQSLDPKYNLIIDNELYITYK
ncbi:MAG TPA: hypothetical protein DCX89_03320 [Saprospirales bacterium]|nr:hypothetical protein [Saprospirales bacterium]HAY70896.1 hypothetical protein [Saprospirales bacterium]HRQ28941.1 ABC transporter ATP-binding protein [Saprospiraceae bacterium]